MNFMRKFILIFRLPNQQFIPLLFCVYLFFLKIHTRNRFQRTLFIRTKYKHTAIFFLINGVLLSLSRVCILLQNARSHSGFKLVCSSLFIQSLGVILVSNWSVLPCLYSRQQSFLFQTGLIFLFFIRIVSLQLRLQLPLSLSTF